MTSVKKPETILAFLERWVIRVTYTHKHMHTRNGDIERTKAWGLLADPTTTPNAKTLPPRARDVTPLVRYQSDVQHTQQCCKLESKCDRTRPLSRFTVTGSNHGKTRQVSSSIDYHHAFRWRIMTSRTISPLRWRCWRTKIISLTCSILFHCKELFGKSASGGLWELVFQKGSLNEFILLSFWAWEDGGGRKCLLCEVSRLYSEAFGFMEHSCEHYCIDWPLFAIELRVDSCCD